VRSVFEVCACESGGTTQHTKHRLFYSHPRENLQHLPFIFTITEETKPRTCASCQQINAQLRKYTRDLRKRSSCIPEYTTDPRIFLICTAFLFFLFSVVAPPWVIVVTQMPLPVHHTNRLIMGSY
ncbi:hypothetical protein ATANTOWER_029806, partial [Ataeniobius toweri]|nr:hypothetical protein [Ataeniobius toweri]